MLKVFDTFHETCIKLKTAIKQYIFKYKSLFFEWLQALHDTKLDFQQIIWNFVNKKVLF